MIQDSVVILARIKDSFLLINQYREAAGEVVTQLPGGGVEDGETLVEAARREFLEETGYVCKELTYLGPVLPAPWISGERTHVYYTEDVRHEFGQQLEGHEWISVEYVPVAECIERVKQHTYTDAELAYALLQVHLQEISSLPLQS